jgi:hypothetical protein
MVNRIKQRSEIRRAFKTIRRPPAEAPVTTDRSWSYHGRRRALGRDQPNALQALRKRCLPEGNDMLEITQRAMEAVGADDPASDWKLAPLTHAAQLPAEAGALRRVLEMPGLQATMAEFHAADAKAVEAQGRYKRVARSRLYAAFAATFVGATFILPLETWLDSTGRSIPAALQYGALAISFLASFYLARAKPFDTWMKARAAAEIARIRLFDQVMEAVDPSPQPAELPLLPLKLEYFRRYQLDVQRRYYANRGGQHNRAAGRTHGWQIASYGLTGAAAAVAIVAGLQIVVDLHVPVPGFVKAVNDAIQQHLPNWINRGILALGAVASALFGAFVSRSLLDLDERNAVRYLTAAENLDYLTEQGLDQARAAAAASAEDAVRSFAGRVQAMISSEHQEWLLLRESVPLVVAPS